MRLDKYISSCTPYSRSEIKKFIKKGVMVNNLLIKDPKYNVNENEDKVLFNDKMLEYKKYVYIMLNKPKNVITATEDKNNKTVIDLINNKDKILKIFPVGRLDKDTEGLILLTNNGELAHKLLSPKKDIFKKYYVEVDGLLDENIKKQFKNGIIIDKNYKCKPSKLDIIKSYHEKSSAYIEISEGKFHQIKKMMKSVNLNVIYLKRLAIGSLILDESLNLGEYRYLENTEIKNLLEERMI